MTWLVVLIALVVVVVVAGWVRKRRRLSGSEPSGSLPMNVRDIQGQVEAHDVMRSHRGQFRD
jgi:K+ transporter